MKPISTDKELAKIADVSADTIWKARAKENQRGGQGGVLLNLNSEKAKENQKLSEGRGQKGNLKSENLKKPIKPVKH